MAQLDVDATKHGIDDNTLTIHLPYLEEGGIRSRDIVDQLREIIEDVLNVQSTLPWNGGPTFTSYLHGSCRLLKTKRTVENINVVSTIKERQRPIFKHTPHFLQIIGKLL
ncbi:hypothetical protein EDD18DRAFT_1368272 [Armillaria luteobubalina]|uniref:Uncharacterized protein n=1 Tax=Armillaria luteobubalina TaxID=153913 RepID=A0AA39NYG2_9AGAR|nr:hypothetical protein EDD18DRAFT_1368272 [Armillaria luteobubalina]